MVAVVALSSLIEARQVWRGWEVAAPAGDQPTGWTALDAILPAGGWPDASLSEILLPVDGVGELQLVLPTLARLTKNMRRVEIVNSAENDVLWATEQCLRSGSCSAVLAWPHRADDRALRRLQVAADTGKALAFVFRDRRHLSNASPAALRLELEAMPRAQIWVRKCRGANVPSQPILLTRYVH